MGDGIQGDNLTARSPNMGWYQDKVGIEALDALGPINRPPEKPLRLPVLKVHANPNDTERVIVVGRVETGAVRTGINVLFSPSGLNGEVQSIHKNGESVADAKTGEIVSLAVGGSAAVLSTSLAPECKGKGVCRVMVASQLSDDPVADAETFMAQVVVLDHPGTIRAGYCPSISIHTAQVACELEDLVSKIDRKTGKEIEGPKPDSIKTGEVAMVRMRPCAPVCVETFASYPPMGRFAIRDHGKTIAVGVVKEVTKRAIPKPRVPGENEYFGSN